MINEEFKRALEDSHMSPNFKLGWIDSDDDALLLTKRLDNLSMILSIYTHESYDDDPILSVFITPEQAREIITAMEYWLEVYGSGKDDTNAT